MSPDSQHPKFVCLDCGRSYKAVETLNRHRKNHVAGILYTCSACNASFKRKDILDRHRLIHDDIRKSASNMSRSGKACDRCSRLKTKCDGLTTCTRCERGGHPCTYRHTTSRASTGRSSTKTLSPDQSPCLTTDEGGSSGSSPSYSLSDPGYSMICHQSSETHDIWARELWTIEDTVCHWPDLDPSLDSNSMFEVFESDSLQLQNPSPALYVDDLAGRVSDSLLPFISCTGPENVYRSYAATSWPQHHALVPDYLIKPRSSRLGFAESY